MKRYLIIADDFTGANDSGVQLTRHGIKTHVIFNTDLITNNDSYVIDTETRQLTPIEAFNKLKVLLKNVDFNSFDYVIKKVDSTLRGNISYEVKAIDEMFRPDKILFAPAYDEIGRITKNSIHYVNGQPITETEFAKDPVKPVTCDNISKLISEAYDINCIHLNSSQLNSYDKIDSHLYSFDCSSSTEMNSIIRCSAHSIHKKLFVGSAGICNAIMDFELPFLPSVALITSVSDATRNQIKYAEKMGINVIKVPVHKLLNGYYSSYTAEAVASILSGKDTAIISSATYDRNDLSLAYEEADKQNITRAELANFIQGIMSQIMKETLNTVKVSGIFLSGGDTAIGFLKSVEASGSDICGEVCTGIPIMKIRGGKLDGMHVITKAGAFGNEDAIAYSMRKLKELT